MTESATSPRVSLGTIALSVGEKPVCWWFFALLFAACALFVEDFFSWVNVKGLALAVSQIGMVGCTMLFCLASGDFDFVSRLGCGLLGSRGGGCDQCSGQRTVGHVDRCVGRRRGRALQRRRDLPVSHQRADRDAGDDAGPYAVWASSSQAAGPSASPIRGSSPWARRRC